MRGAPVVLTGMTTKILLVLAMFLTGCGGGGSTANPCATPGASYLEHCVEESGNCGAISDQVVNIGPEGEVMGVGGTAPMCTSMDVVGCVSHGSGCTVTENGATVTTTFQTTFVADGSSATSIASIEITMGAANCVSTYNCTITRQ